MQQTHRHGGTTETTKLEYTLYVEGDCGAPLPAKYPGLRIVEQKQTRGDVMTILRGEVPDQAALTEILLYLYRSGYSVSWLEQTRVQVPQ